MKIRTLLFLMICFTFLAEAQSPSINQFYKEHKRDKGTVNATLPGWLVKLGIGITRPFVEDDEVKIALRLGKRIKKAKFLVAEDENPISQGEYMKLLSGVKSEGYEELIRVREDGSNVSILSREKKGIINRLLIVVREEDSFVLLSLKTKLKQKDFDRFVNDMIKLEKRKDDETPQIYLDAPTT